MPNTEWRVLNEKAISLNSGLATHNSILLMISISCTNCKALLTIDEAFAGGVCRCQHCGTIQTVPAGTRGHDSSVTGGVISGQSLGGSKVALPRDKQGAGTGLEDLADIVASSGLAGSGLTSRRLSRSNNTAIAVPVAKPSKLVPMIAVGSSIGVVLIGAILFFSLRGDSSSNAGTGGDGPTNVVQPSDGTPPIATVRGPSFCGVPLEGTTTIFVLDRGSGTREVFDLLKSATLKSIDSLGDDRKFQVIFWNNGSDELLFPATGPTYATDRKRDEARKLFDDTAAFGATDAGPSLEKAYAQSPEVVIIASGKGPDLTDEFVTTANTARKGLNIKTHTFSLGEGASDGLKKLADETGGQYKQITPSQLDAFTR